MSEQGNFDLGELDKKALLELAAKRLPYLKTSRVDFLAWLATDWEMYQHFRGYAKAALKAKRQHFSAYMIRERVRWYVNIESRTGGEFKISNDLTPYIARTLALEYPELLTVFKFKGRVFRGLPRLDAPGP